MKFLLPWLLASGLIGYLGRGRRFGFWGFFFFSLIFSPLVGGISLLAAAPGEQQRTKDEQQSRDRTLARVVTLPAARPRAAFDDGTPASNAGKDTALRAVSTLPLLRLVESWAVLIVVFALVYWVAGRGAPPPETRGGPVLAADRLGPLDALQLSLEVGTLGFHAAPPRTPEQRAASEEVTRKPSATDPAQQLLDQIQKLQSDRNERAALDVQRVLGEDWRGVVRVLMSIQRLLVLLLLAIMISRLVAGRQEQVIEQVQGAAHENLAVLKQLQTDMRSQQALIRKLTEPAVEDKVDAPAAPSASPVTPAPVMAESVSA